MTAFVSCCLSREACLEGPEAKSETKLRVCQKCGWKGRWLTTTASALFSFYLLIVPLCHWKTPACDNKKCGASECFSPGIHGKSNTSLCDELKTGIRFSPKKPQSGSHISPSAKRSKILLVPEPSVAEWLQVREKWEVWSTLVTLPSNERQRVNMRPCEYHLTFPLKCIWKGTSPSRLESQAVENLKPRRESTWTANSRFQRERKWAGGSPELGDGSCTWGLFFLSVLSWGVALCTVNTCTNAPSHPHTIHSWLSI